MTINNPEAFCAGLWDWGILDGCFGKTRIKPTDIDGIVERHGKFLWLETKAPGAEIPIGQGRTFEAARRSGIFTIVVIWGETNKPEYLQLMTSKIIQDPKPADLDELRRVVSAWYDWADKQEIYG